MQLQITFRPASYGIITKLLNCSMQMAYTEIFCYKLNRKDQSASDGMNVKAHVDVEV